MSDSDTTPPPSPETKRSSEQAARSIRLPIDTSARQRVNSLPPTRRRQTRRINLEFRRTEPRHPNATRKSCCERWFGRRGRRNRKKKCKKKCKTRKRKRKSKTQKKKRTKRRKKRTRRK